jgi:hypothetical protein
LSSGDGGIAKILGMGLELLGDPPQAGFQGGSYLLFFFNP